MSDGWTAPPLVVNSLPTAPNIASAKVLLTKFSGFEPTTFDTMSDIYISPKLLPAPMCFILGILI